MPVGASRDRPCLDLTNTRARVRNADQPEVADARHCQDGYGDIMRWSAILGLLAAIDAGPALALDCTPPNAAHEIDGILAAGGDPRIMVGTVSAPDPQTGAYRFDGALLGRNIRIGKLSSGIEVSARCRGDRCGELPRHQVQGLFIAEQGSGGIVLSLGPCGQGMHPMPDEAQRAALERCLAEDGCSPADAALFAR